MPDVEASIPLFHTVEGQEPYLDRLEAAGRELLAMLQDRQLSRPAPASKDAAMPAHPDHKHRQAVKIILHSLAHIASWPVIAKGTTTPRQDYVAIPLAKDAFSPHGPYPHLSYSAFRGVFEALKGVGLNGVPWIEVRKGFYDPTSGRSGRTRIRANRPLLDWMTAQGLVFPWHPHGVKKKRQRSHTLLRLRLDEGEEPFAPLHRDLDAEEKILPAMNDALARQRVICRFECYKDFERSFKFEHGKPRFAPGGSQRLYRQFVGRDGRGGRLSGHWVQRMPRDLRHDLLTINGQPTAELDYGSMQLGLLYALADAPVPDVPDLYQVPGMGHCRDDMKAVL